MFIEKRDSRSSGINSGPVGTRRQFLKKTSGSLAIGVAVSQGLIRPISAAAQSAAESSDKNQQIEMREGDRIEDPYRIFAEGGSQEAMLEARKAGKIRYICGTAHNPQWLG